MVTEEIDQRSNWYDSHSVLDKIRGLANGTGYLQLSVNSKTGNARKKRLYIALAQGKVVYSGSRKLEWEALLQVLYRFTVKLRTSETKAELKRLEGKYSPSKEINIRTMISELERANLLSYTELLRAIKLKILSDFDVFLFVRSGTINFIADHSVLLKAPIRGFELNDLLLEASRRHRQWRKLRKVIHSMQSVPIIQPQAGGSTLKVPKNLERILQGISEQRLSLARIAFSLGRDSLEVAELFARLAAQGKIKLEIPTQASKKVTATPEVFIVDDSPILLTQFRRMVSRWGYRVRCSSEPSTVVNHLLAAQPSIIFLDINMPGVTGFELIKQIRRHTKLASIPLVILTGEKSFSNQWRAQWANCKFLVKPLSTEETSSFQTRLKQLLQELVPLHPIN